MTHTDTPANLALVPFDQADNEAPLLFADEELKLDMPQLAGDFEPSPDEAAPTHWEQNEAPAIVWVRVNFVGGASGAFAVPAEELGYLYFNHEQGSDVALPLPLNPMITGEQEPVFGLTYIPSRLINTIQVIPSPEPVLNA